MACSLSGKILAYRSTQPKCCGDCILNNLPRPKSQNLQYIAQLGRRCVCSPNEGPVFRMGDRFCHVYLICYGTVKTFRWTDSGREQIIGFHLPGELLGLDAIGSQRHPSSAQVLEKTELIEVLYTKLENVASHQPALSNDILQAMGRQVRDHQRMMMLLGQHQAEERLAVFLLHLATRAQRQGCRREFDLNMPRTDIGSFLGISPETVSRLIAKFRRDGILSIRRRHVCIDNVELLWAIAGPLITPDEADLFTSFSDRQAV